MRDDLGPPGATQQIPGGSPRRLLAVLMARGGGRPCARVAIGGISMGGFGAYALARLEPGRFCAVGGHSPAIWPVYRDAEPGGFDNASDFARNDVIVAATANPELYGHAQLWLDDGAQDPFFHATDEQLATALHIHITSGLAATTSHTGTRTGATTSASTPTRSRPAVASHQPARRTSSPATRPSRIRRCLASPGSLPGPHDEQVQAQSGALFARTFPAETHCRPTSHVLASVTQSHALTATAAI